MGNEYETPEWTAWVQANLVKLAHQRQKLVDRVTVFEESLAEAKLTLAFFDAALDDEDGGDN